MPTSEALVFDIKRFAVHDGDGLRTTVFFKGCPLRCKWCQNPEGLEPVRQPIYLAKQCIHCERCMKKAKEGQLVWKYDHPIIQHDHPGNFDAIVETCPACAIRYDSQTYTVDKLLKKIREDEVFFRHDGGVTFSGGEPLLQGRFLYEILKACKKEGIHTGIESSMYGNPELVRAIAPYLDRIFCDIKILDPELHEKATGKNNRLILDNIRWLLESPQHRDKVIIRTPLIPGYSGTKENIGAIAQWISGIYPDVHYELLNYNPLAPAKYEMTGKTYPLGDYKPFTKAEIEAFKQTARQNGIKNLVEE